MNVLGLVPARSGSKGLRDKNIRELNGRPLLSYAVENVKAVLGKCCVSTDSEEYAEIAEEWGAIVLERPEGSARDDSRIVEVLAFHGKGYDGVLCQPPTAPFVREETLLKLLAGIHKGSSAVTVSRAREHPSLMVGAKSVYPRQKREPRFFLNGCASFRGSEVLQECDLSTNALWNPNYVEIQPPESINIDDQWDWMQAEWIAGSTTSSGYTTTTSPESSTSTSSSSARI